MRTAHLILLLAIFFLTAADARTRQPDKTDKKAPAAKSKVEPVAGYKVEKIEGFTFLVAEEVFKQDISAYERKPLEVLALECKTLAKILSPTAVDKLRGLVIWVEWDDKVPLSNGRKGNALAVYRGGSAAQMVKEGQHPLRAKTVTIHSLKMLAVGRQPKRDRGDCVLLHEIAHAVHDQLIGYNHPGIKAAYQQAMERKLYDPGQYIATNEREFFAELTCAYLDRLRYYPHTRSDLEKHDAVGFKLMQTIWSAAAKKAEGGKKTAADGSDLFDLDLKLPADVKFGTTILGPAPTAETLSNKVVVIGYWGGNSANVLNRLDRLNDELAAYGVTAIAAAATNNTAEEIKEEAAKRCDGIAVLDKVFIKDKSMPTLAKTQPAGHALVFDHAGKCIFRGTAYNADVFVHAALGRKLVADAAGATPSDAFKPVTDAFEDGESPIAVLPKIAPLVRSQDDATKTAARKLADLILAPGQKALDATREIAKTDPVGAFIAAEDIAARYKNTSLAKQAQSLTVTLRSERDVALELKARRVLAQVQKVEMYLRGQAGSFDPTASEFQAKHRAVLTQLKAAVEQLRKQFPDARATATAAKIAREFGVE